MTAHLLSDPALRAADEVFLKRSFGLARRRYGDRAYLSLYDLEVPMTDQPLRAHFTSEPIELPDGRRIHVSAYPDGSIRFRVDGLPYVLTEAYLSGNPENDKAILKLSPGKQGSAAAYNYVEELEKKG